MRRHWKVGVPLAVCVLGIGGFVLHNGSKASSADDKAADADVPGDSGVITHWFNGWLRLRGADEAKFTAATKRVGFEVNWDARTGNVLYAIPETGAVAAAPSAPNFELRTLRTGKTFSAIRFHSRIGTAHRWITGAKWSAIADPQPTDLGLYDVQMIETGDGGVAAMRIDGTTGKTWSLTSTDKGDAWILLSEP